MLPQFLFLSPVVEDKQENLRLLVELIVMQIWVRMEKMVVGEVEEHKVLNHLEEVITKQVEVVRLGGQVKVTNTEILEIVMFHLDIHQVLKHKKN